jgi:hypothetical protein
VGIQETSLISLERYERDFFAAVSLSVILNLIRKIDFWVSVFVMSCHARGWRIVGQPECSQVGFEILAKTRRSYEGLCVRENRQTKNVTQLLLIHVGNLSASQHIPRHAPTPKICTAGSATMQVPSMFPLCSRQIKLSFSARTESEQVLGNWWIAHIIHIHVGLQYMYFTSI